MGDWFQNLVDRDATLEEAQQLAASVFEFLVQKGIIEGIASDCVLGADSGYPPGPNAEEAVNSPTHVERDLLTNGLAVIIGRTVFHTGQFGFGLICDSCLARFSDEDLDDAWSDAIGEWYDDKGPGIFACPSCKQSKPITEWTFEPVWGFGNLGFLFWNWPPLRDSLVKEISELLGHRIVLVSGKL